MYAYCGDEAEQAILIHERPTGDGDLFGQQRISSLFPVEGGWRAIRPDLVTPSSNLNGKRRRS